jgi:glutamate-1-semialdehyde 2,1-aminomutase
MSTVLPTPPAADAQSGPGAADFYAALLSRQAGIVDTYRALHRRSGELFERARGVYPGGYTRESVTRQPYPTFISRAEGTTMTDADGRPIIDFWFNATSLPLGHAPQVVVEALARQAPMGTAYFAPTEQELRLGEALLSRMIGADRVRFANSGSEAVMMAIRFARAIRRRSTIVKFEGSYHGLYDDVSWSVGPAPERAGDPRSPTAVPESAGLVGAAGRVHVLPYNDAATLEAYIAEHHDEVAAILVEPVSNRIGLVVPEREFLEMARSLCDRYRVVLVFDEVISFRLGYGGAQGRFGIVPDLTTLGKVIGGGLPVGAVVGRDDLLGVSAVSGDARVAHTGTFNGNPLVAAAGLATLNELTPRVFDEFEDKGDYLRGRLVEIFAGLPLQVTGAGSVFKVTATECCIRNYRDAATANRSWEETASLALLNEGFFLTPRLAGCVSSVTSRAQIDDLVEAFQRLINS